MSKRRRDLLVVVMEGDQNHYFSDSMSTLDLSYSSSSFEYSSSSNGGAEDCTAGGGSSGTAVKPYMYEPTSESGDISSDDNENRLDNTDW